MPISESSGRAKGGKRAMVTEIKPISLREEHKRLTRERIISSAEALFQVQGFRATTVDQIVKAAGTAATTFYRHFVGKPDLAWILRDKLGAELGPVMVKLGTLGGTNPQAVRSWLTRNFFPVWQRNHVLYEAYWEATYADPRLASDVVPNSLAFIEEILPDFLSQFKGKARAHAQLKISMLVHFLDRACYMAHTNKEEPETSPILEEMAAMIWRSLFGA